MANVKIFLEVVRINLVNAARNISTIIARMRIRGENVTAITMVNISLRPSKLITMSASWNVPKKKKTTEKWKSWSGKLRHFRDRIRTLEVENDGLMDDAMAFRMVRDDVVAVDAVAVNIVVRANPAQINGNANGNGNGHYIDSE